MAYSNGTNDANGKHHVISNSGTQTFRVSSLSNSTGPQGLVVLNQTGTTYSASDARFNQALYNLTNSQAVGVAFVFGSAVNPIGTTFPVVADFFSFGYLNDGVVKSERVNNAIYRVEVEETGDNKIGRAHV